LRKVFPERAYKKNRHWKNKLVGFSSKKKNTEKPYWYKPDHTGRSIPNLFALPKNAESGIATRIKTYSLPGNNKKRIGPAQNLIEQQPQEGGGTIYMVGELYTRSFVASQEDWVLFLGTLLKRG